ncbi:2,3,4,5-tetrahydropyridine-2,6-dicarboxylate N-acetyltransferase [Mycoplasmatota bacterium]|nr:2,3,4,5-tetrahydropyridine-2,6-dicarboxylate N-acetyltransferase [Mycoplasmatota bacterium]
MEFSTEDIISLIKESQKRTIVVALIKGEIKTDARNFSYGDLNILIDEYEKIEEVIKTQKVDDYFFLSNHRNSAIPLLDYTSINARIEPGAVIRDMVEIGDNAIIMMGAIINIGAKIGSGTMIDMNTVVGGRAIIGDNCHVGAGTVIAGVIEPASAKPVVIGDNVTIGANAVILEGVEVQNGAVIGAGSVVTKDVLENTVVVGSPARAIKNREEVVENKISIVSELREM